MKGLKQGLLVIAGITIISFVSKMADERKNQVPRAIKDRMQFAIRSMSTNVWQVHSGIYQNPVVTLLRLTSDISVLEHLRTTFTDWQLTELTHLDIPKLLDMLKGEQHKAFQRVSYFLTPQVAKDAYNNYYYWQQNMQQNHLNNPAQPPLNTNASPVVGNPTPINPPHNITSSTSPLPSMAQT